MRWLPLLLLACQDVPGPECEAFCLEATSTYGQCLEEWGLEWEDAGYRDAAGFQNACETWVWTEVQLRRDAQVDEPARSVEATCESAATQTCSDVTGFSWNG